MDGHVPSPQVRRARAPGRVNLMGDHTDYNEGLALPMAINLATTVRFFETDTDSVLVSSTLDPQPVELPRQPPFDAALLAQIQPAWARLAAAVLAQAPPPRGGVVEVTSQVPTGAGLSSSAAFSVALARALGFDAGPAVVARMCQRAEAATGIEVGLMDPLVIDGARAGTAMLIDFATLETSFVPIPEAAEFLVVHSGTERLLHNTAYRARRAECEAAALGLGVALGRAEVADLPGIHDALLRQRTRHVVTETQRVREVALALGAGDLAAVGALMSESHRSLAGDFAASTPEVDELVATLAALPGVLGARMTGGGFGGCVVALGTPGAFDPARWPGRAWRVVPSGGAIVVVESADPPIRLP